QGRIVQVGTPHDIYDRPATIFVAPLVGTPRINLLSATQSAGMLHMTGSEIRLALNGAGPTLPGSFTLGIRPEDIQIDAQGAHQGEVSLVEPLGVETIVHIRSGHQTLVSTMAGIAPWRIGDTVRF